MKPLEPHHSDLSDGVRSSANVSARVRGTSRSERWFRSLVQNASDVVAILEADGTFRSLIQNSSDVIAVIGADAVTRYVSPSIERVLGYKPEERIGKRTFESSIVHPDDIERVRGIFAEIARDHAATATAEFRMLHADGSMRHAEAIVKNLLHDPSIGGVVVNYRDITERKLMEERLEYQAFHDPLTDLPNRQLFVDRLGQALSRTERRRGRKVAVLFMDLDGFKVINDSLGHEVGDRLLVEVAERLQGCLRPEDTFARFGGDEFTVLIEEVEDPEDAVRVAKRVVEALEESFVLGRRELFVRASIGIAMGEDRTKSTEDLLRDADAAMYRAKEAASGYRVFDPSMHERVMRRLDLEGDLRRAIEAEEFVLHYQPIMHLKGEGVWGVEALVRWNHPQRGLVSPIEFIPIAEETGLIVPLGRWVLQEACRQAKEWQEEHPCIPPLVISVNLSARQLQQSDLAEIVEKALREAGLEAHCPSLDVTETTYIKVLEGNTATLDRLKALGVGLSIDDFGMGYSSLSYLKRLPADELKIDKVFAAGLGEDIEDTAIVQMVIELAHTLGMEVMAEGVESADQAEQLTEMGCDLAQGCHFARPLPPEAASEFLAR